MPTKRYLSATLCCQGFGRSSWSRRFCSSQRPTSRGPELSPITTRFQILCGRDDSERRQRALGQSGHLVAKSRAGIRWTFWIVFEGSFLTIHDA
jgi:hypothetical protein